MLNPETRAMLARHMNEILGAFAQLVAARLGRSVEEIRSGGLRAGDFPADEAVELTLPDGSMIALHYAFFVHDEAQGMVGVFTEHCGYHCFAATGVAVREIRDGALVAQHFW